MPKQGFSLISSTILTLFISLFTYFFIVANAKGATTTGAIVYFIYLQTLIFLMFYTGKIGKYRRLIFISFALLFFPAFMSILWESRGSFILTPEDIAKSETPFCHIVIPFASIPYLLSGTVIFPAKLTNYFASVYSMLIIWAISVITIGRGWCSWACFYGGWDDGFSGLSKKKRITLDNPSDEIRYFGFVMLLFTVLASMASFVAVYCEWFCPFKIVTEFEQITSIKTLIATILFVVIFFSLVVVLPFLTKKRTQCSSFCPFGAFASLTDCISLYKVKVNVDECVNCGLCIKSCPSMAITDESLKRGKMLINCTKCGLCIQKCPKKAISYSLAGYTVKSGKKGVARVVFEEILSPQALFISTAFILGMILSSKFGPSTIQRVINLITKGTFGL